MGSSHDGTAKDRLAGTAQDRAGGKGEPDRTVWASAGAVFVLLVTLVIGVSSQGAFYSRTRLHLALGLTLAVALTLPAGSRVLDALRRPPALTGSLLAAWILAVGAMHGTLGRGLPAAGLAMGVVAVFVVVPCLLAVDREMLASSLVWIGGLVGLTSWLGVVLHLHRWAWEGQGLWRASGAITYPNATAALLVSLALWSVARMSLPSDPDRDTTTSVAFGPRWTVPALVTVMLTAAAATLSRGGALALLAGGAVLLVRSAPGTRGAAVHPVLGATVAFAGLAPSLLSGEPARPLPAVVGLALGILIGVRADEQVRARQNSVLTGAAAAVGLVPGEPRRRILRAAAAGGVAVLAAGPLLLADGFVRSLHKITDVRVLTGPSYRVDAARAAFDRITDSPWIGTGPGEGEVSWTTSSGVSRSLMFLHDEYLQVVLELGVLTALLVLVHLLACAHSVLRAPRVPHESLSSRRARRNAGAGGLAAITAFAVHSALDFTWHLPALPLVVAAVLALTPSGPECMEQPERGQESTPDDVDVRDGVTDVREAPAKNVDKSSITHSTHPPMT